jgi:hypothetical protein
MPVAAHGVFTNLKLPRFKPWLLGKCSDDSFTLTAEEQLHELQVHQMNWNAERGLAQRASRSGDDLKRFCASFDLECGDITPLIQMMQGA